MTNHETIHQRCAAIRGATEGVCEMVQLMRDLRTGLIENAELPGTALMYTRLGGLEALIATLENVSGAIDNIIDELDPRK